MLGTARVAFSASLIAWTTPDQGARSPAVRDAQRMHDTLRAAVAVHRAELQARWFLSDEQASFLQEKMTLTVGDPSVTVGARWKPKQASVIGYGFKALMDTEPRGVTEHFAHRVPFFIAALSDGWPLMFALKAWSSIGKGRFAENGLCPFQAEDCRPDEPSGLCYTFGV